MQYMKYILIISTLLPFLLLLLDMYGNSFDSHFSDKTKTKLRVKDNSILRKIVPIKEKDLVSKDGVTYGHRYFLIIRALPLVIYFLLLILIFPLSIVNCFIEFIPNAVMIVISVSLVGYYIIHELIISICSQGLHL